MGHAPGDRGGRQLAAVTTHDGRCQGGKVESQQGDEGGEGSDPHRSLGFIRLRQP